jgi:hypothetical protein
LPSNIGRGGGKEAAGSRGKVGSKDEVSSIAGETGSGISAGSTSSASRAPFSPSRSSLRADDTSTFTGSSGAESSATFCDGVMTTGSSWAEISSCAILSFDPAELDLPLDDPPITAAVGRDAGAEA